MFCGQRTRFSAVSAFFSERERADIVTARR
jgi:hypothetical protein